jgi:fatty-acyl-CoA synthase
MTSVHTSYARGETDPALLEDTVGAILERAAVQWPETEALVSIEQSKRWTYYELNHYVNCTAAGLLLNTPSTKSV